MILLLFIFGLTIGSFLNCLIYRINNDLPWAKGRSLCPACKHQLSWADNIPLLSFILLRGKCRYCHKPISIQYPLVELAVALFTILIFDTQSLIPDLILVYILMAIFVSDLIYETIPDLLLLPAIGLSLVFYHSPLDLASGFGAGLFFYLLYLATKGKGMGLGDVKLVILLGLMLGWPNIIVCLFLAFLTGATVGVILILAKLKKFGQHLPFGPFLIGSWLIANFWAREIINLYFNFLIK